MDTSKFSRSMQKAIRDAVAYLIKNPDATAYRVAKETGVTPYIARKLIAERQTPVAVLTKPQWKRAPETVFDPIAAQVTEALADPPGVRMLNEAVDTFKQRGQTYGSAAPHWREVATMWSAIAGTVITADTAVKMMIALKLLRLKGTPNHRDSIVDIAGYAAVLSDVVEE